MKRFRLLFEHPGWLSIAVLIALHYLAIQVSFFCGKTLENEVMIWLPNSVLLIALLRFKWRFGLLMVLLTWLVNVAENLPSATLAESMLLGLVNLVEVGLTWLIMRLTNTSPNLTRLKDYSNFVLAGPLIGALVSGILGAAVITAFGATSPYLTLLRVWWFDDGLGLLIFAPILMLATSEYEQEERWKTFDVLMVLIIVAIIGGMFYSLQQGGESLVLTPTLILPFALMLALRFKILSTSVGVALIALALSKMAALGLNLFGDADLNHLIVHTQEFILSISIICIGSSIFKCQMQINERDLEQKVSERTVELSASLERLQKMQAELIQSAKLAALGTLVAGVAHELNTPIGIIIMAASTLRQHADELVKLVAAKKLRRSDLEEFIANLQEETNLIERNVMRASHLVVSFKQIAVDQAGEQRRSFDLLQLTTENLLTLLPQISRSNRTLQIDIPEPVRLDSYPGPLGQVIASLVGNALLHAFAGREQGQIMIRARCRHDQVLLEISDDGIGMSEIVAKRIFDPFFTTRMGAGNSGLGLYIVNNIVTGILGGSIALKTRAQQGAHFELLLPLVAPQADRQASLF